VIANRLDHRSVMNKLQTLRTPVPGSKRRGSDESNVACRWEEAHDGLFDGRATDGVQEIVHVAGELGAPGDFVLTVQATAVPGGKIAEAMAGGIEITDALAKATGQPAVFDSTVTAFTAAWRGTASPTISARRNSASRR
jgi:hypothetical protein